MAVVGLTIIEHVDVVGVVGSKGVAKVREKHAAIAVVVELAHKGVDVILVAVDAEVKQRVVKVWGCHPSFLVCIEHLEGVLQVEVALLSESDLHFLYFSLLGYDVFQDRDESVFFIKSKWGNTRQRLSNWWQLF